MERAEYFRQEGCLQRDSAEHEEYAEAQSASVREGKEAGGADLLERILGKENLTRVIPAKSKRAGSRLLESSKRFLEGKLKLKLNTEKSKVACIQSEILNFWALRCRNGMAGRLWDCDNKESEEAGYAGIDGLPKWEYPKRILGSSR